MKQDVVNCCIDQATATIRAVNDDLLAFVRELGGSAYLPEAFTLDVEEMTSLERAIDEAVVAGDLKLTEELCDEYHSRFTAYLSAWRKIVAKGARV